MAYIKKDNSTKEEVELLFKSLKEKKSVITETELTRIYDNALVLASKYVKTGQIFPLRKLAYVLDTIDREKEIVKLGINTFVYKDDIDYYIDNASKTPVKIIELSNYEREVPDEIAEVVERTKDIFDEFYVVFTDYTGKEDRRIEAEKRSTDPILFGVFIDNSKRVCIDRFYYLGDWVDEYCDLTLDKMISDILNKTGNDVKRVTRTPQTLQDLKDFIDSYDKTNSTNTTPSYIYNPNKKKNLLTTVFNKVKTFFMS